MRLLSQPGFALLQSNPVEKWLALIRVDSADAPSGLGMTNDVPNRIRAPFGPGASHGRTKTPTVALLSRNVERDTPGFSYREVF